MRFAQIASEADLCARHDDIEPIKPLRGNGASCARKADIELIMSVPQVQFGVPGFDLLHHPTPPDSGEAVLKLHGATCGTFQGGQDRGIALVEPLCSAVEFAID